MPIRAPFTCLLLLAVAAVLPGPGLGAETPAPPAPANAPAGAPAAAPSAPAIQDPARPAPGQAWRGAKWGMSPAQVVAAFPGLAFLQEPVVTLPDGNVVGAGINGIPWEGLTVNVRFIFAAGRLVLVSLRTEQNRYVDGDAYARLRKELTARWGAPLEDTKDDNFIDMRQTRWNRGPDRADLKYIPGVVAMIFYPRPAAP